jgi:hypothetical protein
MDRNEAQRRVNRIVGWMVDAGYPVEATHKHGYRPDYISCASHGDWIDKQSPFGCSFAEHNFASILIGGWHDKYALIALVAMIRRDALEPLTP